MFYGGHGLHGRSDDQSSFLMTPPGESYDYAHFEFVMRGIQAAREKFPEIDDYISLSMHCEAAEIMTAYTEMIEADPNLDGLAAYSAARPPHSEGLAIAIAAYLAHATGLGNVNLLHLSSEKALESARMMAQTYPHIDFRREVTIGHLLTDHDSANGLYGKVNPPLRSREDVEALWDAVLAGEIDWVVSDHACCKPETKLGDDPEDVWQDEDYPEPERKRHLLRLWLAPPNCRPLAPVIAERFGSIEQGTARGGIRVPGQTLQAPLQPE
jgi:allantoinase